MKFFELFLFLSLFLDPFVWSKLITSSTRVALTREKGQNGKLRRLLSGIECIEAPCIEIRTSTEAIAALRDSLLNYDIILATSPNTARILIQIWNEVGRPQIKVAAVGFGTARILQNQGLVPAFVSSVATGEHLAESLPHFIESPASFRPISSVLYPTSALAPNTIPAILRRRGFNVQRIDVYATCPAVWSRATHRRAKSSSVVALASPSAATIWHSRIGKQIAAVTIGPTTTQRCRELGFADVFEASECSVEAIANRIRTLTETCK